MGFGRKYKIRLSNGRILGPLELERVAKLVLKNRITGEEMAREYPQGDWKGINLIPELAEILIAHLRRGMDGQQTSAIVAQAASVGAQMGATQVGALPTVVLGAPTVALVPEKKTKSKIHVLPPPLPENKTRSSSKLKTKSKLKRVENPTQIDLDEQRVVLEGHTPTPPSPSEVVAYEPQPEPTTIDDGQTRTPTEAVSRFTRTSQEPSQMLGSLKLQTGASHIQRRNISHEKTILFQRDVTTVRGAVPANSIPGRKKPKLTDWVRALVLGALLGWFGYETFIVSPPEDPALFYRRPDTLRPRVPLAAANADPALSEKLLKQAMPFYNADTIIGYHAAADLFLQSAHYNIGNVKALALLASSYLNLIDVSNKDDRYFLVISQLIEASRAKALDLPESVIADVEFYITVNRPEAAQVRIDEYTRKYNDFPKPMFYYIAQAFMARGDVNRAARFISNYDEKVPFSPKVFYLRGQIAERLGDNEAALIEYKNAITVSKSHHSKSHLRIAEILAKQGKLREAAPHLGMILAPDRVLALSSVHLAEAYWLQAQVLELDHKYDEALAAIERAVNLEPDQSDYLLELYTLRARMGDSVKNVRNEAKMFAALSEAEQEIKFNHISSALAKFMDARSAAPQASLPLVKMGDLFLRRGDLANARRSYEQALDRAPHNIKIATKYIDSLIQSYEWEKAERVMRRYREMDVPQSALDKAAGDIYARQGRYAEAQGFYKKAMARPTIDSTVYIAYANSLVATQNYKEAPFFYALALRFDPLNMDAIIGTAKSIAGADSLDRAIVMLQDELKKAGGTRAELLAAIAEIEVQKGEWMLAQQYVEEAMAANPDYALPWKLQAQIYLNLEGVDKDAIEKAMAAFQSYSDRNQSDPSGFVERYKILVRQKNFTKASDELKKVYAAFPKYPMLNYYYGALYGLVGDHPRAIEAFQKEIHNNPTSVDSLVMLGRELISECDLPATKPERICDPSAAMVELNKAIALAPGAASPRHWAGYANFRARNYQAAIALYKAAIAIDRGNPLLFRRLGDAYRENNESQEARKAYEAYLKGEPFAQDKDEVERLMRQ